MAEINFGRTQMKTIYFAKVKPEAKIPSKRDEDAGYDIYACFEEDFVKFEPFETKLIPSGIACAVPKNHYMQIEERSSTGFKGLKKSAGVVDSGYRGEIFVCLYNANPIPLYISKLPYEEIEKLEKQFVYISYQKAIAQGIVHKVNKFKVKQISHAQLKAIPSARKDGALGSSKK